MDATTRVDLRKQLASVLDDRANYLAAESRYSEALEIAETAGLREAAIGIRGGIGFMLAKQRRHEAAYAALSRAIADSSALHGADSVETARLRMFLAEARMLAGHASEASAESERALRTLRKAMRADDPELLGLLTSQAAILRTLGDNDGSIAVLKEIIAQREALLDHDSFLLANAYSGLGSAYYEQGQTLLATEQLVAALEIGRATLDPNDPSFAIDLNNVGSLYEEQGDYARAEPFLREALAVYREHAREEPFQLTNLTQNLGRLLMLAGKSAEARTLLQQPIPTLSGADWDVQRARQQLHLAEWERRYGSIERASALLDQVQVAALGGPDSPRVGALLRYRGLVERQRGRDDEARELLQRAGEHWARTRNPDYVGVGEVELDLAELEFGAGRAERARAHAVRAERILDPVLAKSAPQRARLAAVRAPHAR